MYTLKEKIVPVYIEDEMKDSYISYAMSVIVGRALPDVRDGLKPVHRRILYAMKEIGLDHSKAYKKAARIVGEVLGKYHPHGDSAVYDSLVRMVQEFSLRYPLVDGQGNFGSVDGDAPAAMRYTEARLQAITEHMLTDLDKETVNFTPNFDESLMEPVVLPAKLPNLLINGASGIAVGMATNIPPHNITEIIDAVDHLIDHPEATIKDLMKKVTGPDFPTGGIICGRDGIKSAYHTGKGRLRVQARACIEQEKSGKQTIVITEIPYQVNKANLIEAIARLVQDKKITGISDLRDESDKDGLRVTIDLKRDANPQVVLNLLYKHTQMSVTFGVIMLALVNSKPQVLTLKQMLEHFINHRREVIRRRTLFDLRKAQERAHILEGLKIAISNLDAVIKTIRASKNAPEAKERLIDKFDFSDRQAQAILEMQLQRLTALERDKIEEEYLELIKKIEWYQAILASDRKILDIIQEETREIRKKYGDERRTEIIQKADDLEIEDLIVEEDMVITISHSGYIKRLPIGTYRRQKRGGVGVSGGSMREEDFSEHLFIASTHDYVLFFTSKGKVYWIKVHEIPQGGRLARGKAIVNLLQVAPGETVSAHVPVREFDEERYLVMATEKGIIKKTKLMAYSNPRKGGIIAIGLDQGDELIGVKLTNGKDEIILATRKGLAIRFSETNVRDMGRAARGVKGISLGKGDSVEAMEIVEKEVTLLSVTENGYGKRTLAEQYRKQTRGGKGIINVKVTAKTGQVIGTKAVRDPDELMLVTHSGMIVRCFVKDIRQTGRNAQGVRIMKPRAGDKVSSCALVAAGEREHDVESPKTVEGEAVQTKGAEEKKEVKKKPAPKDLTDKKKKKR